MPARFNKFGVGEMVVDSSEIINTLRGGGISSVGYAISEALPKGGRLASKSGGGLLGGLLGKKEKRQEPHIDITSSEDKSAKIIGLVRRAMLGRLTLPCDYSTAERALVLVAGPPTELEPQRCGKIQKLGRRKYRPVSRSAVVTTRLTAGMLRQSFCLQRSVMHPASAS